MQTLDDILDRVKRRLGVLARRVGDTLIAPSDSDDELLTIYTREGLIEIARHTGRLERRLEPTLAAGQHAQDAPRDLAHLRGAYVAGGRALEHVDGKRARALVETEAREGEVEVIGFSGGQLVVHPAPKGETTLALHYISNGDFRIGAGELAELDALLAQLAPELRRALADYVQAQWLRDVGEEAQAGRREDRFWAGVDGYRSEPRAPSTSERPYRPLG
jgi:hypothetical protein